MFRLKRPILQCGLNFLAKSWRALLAAGLCAVSCTRAVVPSEESPDSSAPPKSGWIANLGNLPRPILDDHPEWIKAYNRAWELAKVNIHFGTKQNGFVEAYNDEAFCDGIFQWDTCFIMMFTKYSNGEFPGILSLDNFYRKQHANGFIARQFSETTGADAQSEAGQRSINPPLYSWAEWENFLVTGDATRFSKPIISNGMNPGITKTVFERLCVYYQWIKEHRRNGLLYWQSGMGSGMDNGPAYAYPTKENQYWTIDLSSQQAQNAHFLAKIAGVLGNREKQAHFEKEFRDLKKEINDNLWDAEDGIYYNKDAPEKWRKTQFAGSFWPMVARVAEPEHVDALVGHLNDPKEFNLTCRVPTLSADNPRYTGTFWLGGVWAPTNYAIVKGLDACGREVVARAISVNYIENLAKDCARSNTFRENYSSAKGTGSGRKDFVGWTGVGPIALLIEDAIGIRCNAYENTITWFLESPWRNGIENLHFNGGVIRSMVCAQRAASTESAQIRIDASKEFTLTCRIGGKDLTRKIAEGNGTYVFGGDP